MKITKIFDYFKGNKELKHEKAIENIQKKRWWRMGGDLG